MAGYVTADRFKIIGIRADGPGKLRHSGEDFTAAWDAAMDYRRECRAGKHPGVYEVRMTREDHWGEVHVSGRWGVQ